MTTILHKRGIGKPSTDDLSAGEIALDTSTGTAYTKLSNGAIVEIGGPGGDSAGAGMVIQPDEPADPVTGLQWLESTTGKVWLWDDDKWLEFPAACPDGGGSSGGGSGSWEHIETVSGAGVVAIEADIPSGYEYVRVSLSALVVKGSNPNDSSTKGYVKMRLRNDGLWLDGKKEDGGTPSSTAQQKPYRVTQQGYRGSTTVSNTKYTEAHYKLNDGLGFWGPVQTTFELSSYENPASSKSPALIKHFSLGSKDSDGTVSYVVGAIGVRNDQVHDGRELKIDGIQLFTDTADHTLSGSLVIEGIKADTTYIEKADIGDGLYKATKDGVVELTAEEEQRLLLSREESEE